MRKAIVGCALAAGLALGMSGNAFAGETKGNGDPILTGAHTANSACAFSGRDLPDAEENQPPELNDDFVTGGHVQSYGQWVRGGFKGVVPSPGEACRGNVEGEG